MFYGEPDRCADVMLLAIGASRAQSVGSTLMAQLLALLIGAMNANDYVRSTPRRVRTRRCVR